jgi:sugar/nucleoside kinase (ribokinase family)
VKETRHPHVYTATSYRNQLGAFDWYPEVRNWFTVDNLIQIAADTRLWLNLARHHDDASLDSLANAEAELVQVSLRCGNVDAHEIVKKIFNTTSIQSAITTFGCAGSAIYRRNGEKHRRVPREPIPGNRSGAGAIFIGALMSNIMLGQSWEDAQPMRLILPVLSFHAKPQWTSPI